MADLDFTVNADTSGAQRSLRTLENSIGGIEKAFGALQTVIGGLAIGSFIGKALQMADAISDTAKAAGISTQALMGFSEAVAQNGGDFDRAQAGVLNFNQAIADAASGNAKAQEQFAKLGVSLNDLRTLSEQDLLDKTVKGLGNLTDVSQRAAIGQDMFGKAAKGVDFVGVAAGIDALTAAQSRNSSAIETAAQVSDSLAASYRELQTQILIALQPLAKLAQALLDNKAAVATVIDTIFNLVAAITALFAINKVTSLFATFTNELSKNGSVLKSLLGTLGTGAALTSAQQGVRGLKIEWMELTNVFSKVGTGVEATSGVFSKLFSTIGGISKAFVRFIPIIGQVVSAFLVLDGVVKLFNKGEGVLSALDNLGKKAADLLGISYKTEAQKKKEAEAAKEVTAEVVNTVKAEDDKRTVIEAGAEAFKKQVIELQKGVDAYRNSNAELERRLKFEGSLIGLSEQQKQIRQSSFDLESNYLREVTRLTEQYNEKSQSGKKEDLAMLPEIQKALQQVTANYQEQIGIVKSLTEENQKNVELEKQRQAISDFMTKTQIDNAKNLRDIQADTAKLTMTDIEKKYFDIARAAEESGRSAVAAENARRKSQGVPEMSEEEVKQWYKTATSGVRDLLEAQQKHSQTSRSWSTGWVKSFKEYQDAAGNAAAQAENIFKKATQGMEDMIVNFAKTGKFEWKQFVASMAEELLRGQIRSAISSVLGPIGDFFGLDLGGMGAGVKGASANDPMYVYDISGGGAAGTAGAMGGRMAGSQTGAGMSDTWEKVKTGASSVWDSVKSVGSSVGDALGGVWQGVQDFGSSIWDTVSSIGSGVSDFFSGFSGMFANGGSLGAGKWGIAGESGPEIVSGPANITPMGGSGMQSVTYNINAVDANSFKAMIAADPSFIHAVAMQGAGRIPSRR